jgi:hypothetical protein
VFCEGVSPKKSLLKIGEPSHTRKLTWWESEGAKNTTHFQTEFLTTRFFATRFFQMPADVVGNRRGKNTPHSAVPSNLPPFILDALAEVQMGSLFDSASPSQNVRDLHGGPCDPLREFLFHRLAAPPTPPPGRVQETRVKNAPLSVDIKVNHPPPLARFSDVWDLVSAYVFKPFPCEAAPPHYLRMRIANGRDSLYSFGLRVIVAYLTQNIRWRRRGRDRSQ